MLKSHERFHSVSGKRQILIVDDEVINREILGACLQDFYEVSFAADGQEALDLMYANKDTLSVVLLDLMMPVMSGVEMLRKAKEDPSISQIPIIVVSADQKSEIECLTIGAIDFIQKPYPNAGVVQARVRRTIELSEDRQIISSTERDTLTGLYNREFFYRYAEQFDTYHKGMEMDAIVVDINHFHMINERFGTAYGDTVLRRIGEALRSQVADSGGIVCRREADTFMVYCPNGIDHADMLDTTLALMAADDTEGPRIWLRMGVYAKVDKSLEIERRFDRAKMAADTVQGSFTRRIGVYDSTLHERELYSEQLIEDFDTAIAEHQFQVFFQPKFDVRPDIPVLASAEALVRWRHPKFGMISPGIFIPLFEDNGLIQRLDLFVWNETARQIKGWKDRFNFSVPVSVNVSRVDMYDPQLVDTLKGILVENDLTMNDLHLEITESAYTQDSEQIIQTVSRLRALGFIIEMDDFGTGYSSLNMISTLPIDALKLDMQFIRNAFNERHDTRMIEVIIDIADYLDVPVIAEGVETQEQMLALKEMGCEYVQGFYFSRPVPAEEYERFVIERKEMGERGLPPVTIAEEPGSEESVLGAAAQALSSGFEVIYYIDTQSGHYVEFGSSGRREDLQIERSGDNFFVDEAERILSRVCDEDATRVQLFLEKDALLAQVSGQEPFLMTYRVQTDVGPVFYNLKAVRSYTHDDHHIVIGVSNVDRQVREAGAEAVPANELDFGSLAKALSADLESIYYIDIETGTYQEFRTDTSFGGLRLKADGADFFVECAHNIAQVVYAEDRQKFSRVLDKGQLLAALDEHPVFSMVYRLVVDGEPIFYRLEAALAKSDGPRHVIIGISNVDAQLSDEERAGATLAERHQSAITYASIVQALATDYFSIYYVDTVTDQFVEYSSQSPYRALGIEKSGSDFFGVSRRNVTSVVHPDDVEMFLSAFTKQNVMDALERDRTFTLTYRLLLDGVPAYVHMKITRMENKADSHIVVGVSNVDDQIRREQEHARAMRLANQDALTGVKSKHAYTDEERRINQAIIDRTQVPFAVAVCDVNDLKRINDTLGHTVGDQYIKDACMVVCNVFKHSPVYRVGGDEFVAILRGRDYEEREALMSRLESNNMLNKESGEVCIAGGLAEWRPGKDKVLASVFERADEAMYDDKRRLKQLAEAQG